jgi:hypothetical protein
MKKIALLVLTISLSFYSTAQDNPKQKEVGLVFSNFDNFGITYRFGNNKSLWRINALLINGNNSTRTTDSLSITNEGAGIGVQFGKEFRKKISNSIELRYGLDLAFNYRKSSRIVEDGSIFNSDSDIISTTYTPSIKLVIGLNYVFNDNFLIGAELLPYFSYTSGKTKKYDFNNDRYDITEITGFGYGFSNDFARITALFRF